MTTPGYPSPDPLPPPPPPTPRMRRYLRHLPLALAVNAPIAFGLGFLTGHFVLR